MNIRLVSKLLSKTLLLSTLVLAGGNAFASEIRILAYGDSNTWGWNPVGKGFPAERYSDEDRWAGVLDDSLGDKFKVIVDGMVGRTTDVTASDPVGKVSGEYFNGRASLPAVIARNAPIDLVIIMLGTNDLQAGREREPALVAKAAFDLANLARSVSEPTWSSYPAPEVLIVSPPALRDTSKTPLSGLFSAGEEPSKLLSAAFHAEAKARGENVFTAGDVIETDGIDGVHLSKGAHKRLGEELSIEVSKMFGSQL